MKLVLKSILALFALSLISSPAYAACNHDGTSHVLDDKVVTAQGDALVCKSIGGILSWVEDEDAGNSIDPVHNYFSYGEANASGGFPPDTLVTIGNDKNELWARTSTVGNFPFPGTGVENADWFKVGSSDPVIENWAANTSYEIGDKVVVSMPVNADFIGNDGAIVGVDYILEANAARPNTVTDFDDAEADSGAWDLVSVYRINGTDDRVFNTTGIMTLDPISTLSNSDKSEYIRWTTVGVTRTARFVFNPALITVWNDYTGNNLVQPTAINDDVVIPADSSMVVHRSGNAVNVLFFSNKGGPEFDLTGITNDDTVKWDAANNKFVPDTITLTGNAVERIVYQRNRGDVMSFGDFQFRVPSSGNSSLQFRSSSGVVNIGSFTTKWSNQQGGASENNFGFALGSAWGYFRANGALNLTLHNSYQDAMFTANGWLYRVEVIVGSSWTNNRFSFTRWRLDAVKGDPGNDGTNGTDGVDASSVDHISLTTGDSSPGTTDTYTLWADAGETVSLGTYDVPIPSAAGVETVELASYSGSYVTGRTFTLAGGRTWQDVLDEFQFVYVLVGGNSLFSHDQTAQFYVGDLASPNRDMAVTGYMTHGSNAYHMRMQTPFGTSTTVQVNNDGSNMQVQRIKVVGIK